MATDDLVRLVDRIVFFTSSCDFMRFLEQEVNLHVKVLTKIDLSDNKDTFVACVITER